MIPSTTINGEASAAILVSHGGNHDRMLGYATRMRGEFNGGRAMPEASVAAFRAIYNDTLAEVIAAALRHAGLSVDDLALLLPHNVNRVSWERVSAQLGLPVERVFLQNVPETGHCFGADPFLNYRSASDLGLIAPGQHYLLASAGQGATFSAMVFVR
jgi:3-oxoacyl-[acyl-carrier-protein] synthase-3